MLIMEMLLGHSASQAPVFVHPPKPSSSILEIIFFARFFASTLPCGSFARCETFADTNSIAEEFLQAATQAPQPIHAAASIASSASSYEIGMAFPSGTPPVFTETKPPACRIFSKAERSTQQDL